MSLNLPPQRGGGGLIEFSELQSIAQQTQVPELTGAGDAMSEVMLECGSAWGTQLSVEIAL
jgi:hypothetical protein